MAQMTTGHTGKGMRVMAARLFLVSAYLVAQPAVFAAELAMPESVGLSSAGLAAVTQRLQRHVDEGDIAGVVAAVARDGKLVYQVALGQQDIEAKRAMQEDALFRIYSMAREITSVAALTLYDQGAFEFDDPRVEIPSGVRRPACVVRLKLHRH